MSDRWGLLRRASALLLLTVGTVAAQQSAPVAAVPTLEKPASAPELIVPVSQLTPQQMEAMQGRLRDWPGLGAYREENRKLGPPAAGQARVVFFGDSITYAWGHLHGKFFPDMPWINRGISGQTTPQMVVRFRQDVIELQPQAVVILAGINDIAGNTGPETLPEIESNFRSMVQLAKAAHIRVVLCSVLPAGRFPWRPEADPKAEVKALNTWLRGYAAEQHVTYLDYYSSMAAPDGSMKPGLSMEGVHPSDAGYAVMEPMAKATVEQVLTQARP